MNSELLHKFFQCRTTPQEDETVRVWLAASADNQKRFMDERKLFDLLLMHENNRALNNQSVLAQQSVGIRFYLKEITKVAAVILLTFLSCWYYFSQMEDDDQMLMQTIKVPAGQRMNITLPDGTNIWLNAKTTLQYPVTFSKKNRSVILDGQAWFDVVRNENLPFIVQTPYGMVEALGTSFDVLAYSDDPDFETTLVDGSVKVELKDKKSQSLILQPSYKSFLKDGQLETVFVDDFNDLLWREGLTHFRNEPFEEIMKKFEKIYDITILIQNSPKRKSLYTGKFRVGDGVEYALRVLQRDVHFTYERDNDKNTITIK